MRKLFKVFSVITAVALLIGSIGGHAVAEAAVDAPQAVIFPVNKASILAGSIFDLKVELNHIPSAPTEFAVRVQGVNADTFFNQAASTGATTQNGRISCGRTLA